MENHNAQAAYGLAQIGAFLRSEQWRTGEEQGLTPTQITILASLRRLGPSRIQALAGRLRVTQPTASDAVAALMAKKLVRKASDPDDGRAVRILLTAAGKRAARHCDDYPDALLAALAQLTGPEQGAFHRSLSKLIRSLQDLALIEPQRLCVTCRYFRPNGGTGADKPHFCEFVNAAFGDASLRIDCGDHVEADSAAKERHWQDFLAASSA